MLSFNLVAMISREEGLALDMRLRTGRTNCISSRCKGSVLLSPVACTLNYSHSTKNVSM